MVYSPRKRQEIGFSLLILLTLFGCNSNQKSTKEKSDRPSTIDSPFGSSGKEKCESDTLSKYYHVQESVPLQAAFCLELFLKNRCAIIQRQLEECVSIHPLVDSDALKKYLTHLNEKGLIDFE